MPKSVTSEQPQEDPLTQSSLLMLHGRHVVTMATGVTSCASNSTATRCPRAGCTSSGPRTPTDRARPPSTLARENQSPSAWRAIETKRPSPGTKETAASCALPGQRFAKKNAAGQNATSQIPCDRLRVTVGPATAPFPSTFLGEGKTRQQTQPVCGLCWEGPGGCASRLLAADSSWAKCVIIVCTAASQCIRRYTHDLE
jgi:hypothetical protein